MKVLIVEDNKGWAERWTEELLAFGYTAVWATTITGAYNLYDQNQDIAGIIMDACVPGDRPNTMELIAALSARFKGPMVGASTISYFTSKLVEAGCTKGASKFEAVSALVNLMQMQSV